MQKKKETMEAVQYLPYAAQVNGQMQFGLEVRTAGAAQGTCYADLFSTAQDAAAFAALLNSNAVELCHLFDVLEDYLG